MKVKNESGCAEMGTSALINSTKNLYLCDINLA